eukprot:m.92426 g.92426  ORF g.92426 m.92426 type:complete len:362 (+) comp9957_c0_seq1:52-1137(+)
MQTMLVRSVRLGRSAATAAVATPIARARTVAASSYTPRINTFSCLGRTSHHVGAVQATSVGHAVCGGQHRSYASAAEATESSGGDAVNGGAPAVPEGVRPIRFIVPDKPVAASLSDVMAQLRGELAARAAVRSARNPGWTPHDQTVEAVFTVSTHDKNKKKGIPRDPFRGLVTLPHRFGPTKNIAVLASGDEADRAKEAGATTVGGTDILPDLARGKIAFDVLLATPEFLNATKKFGRDLGPKMPSVKRGEEDCVCVCVYFVCVSCEKCVLMGCMQVFKGISLVCSLCACACACASPARLESLQAPLGTIPPPWSDSISAAGPTAWTSTGVCALVLGRCPFPTSNCGRTLPSCSKPLTPIA